MEQKEPYGHLYVICCDICTPFVMTFVLLSVIAGEGTCAVFLPVPAKRNKILSFHRLLNALCKNVQWKVQGRTMDCAVMSDQYQIINHT